MCNTGSNINVLASLLLKHDNSGYVVVFCLFVFFTFAFGFIKIHGNLFPSLTCVRVLFETKTMGVFFFFFLPINKRGWGISSEPKFQQATCSRDGSSYVKAFSTCLQMSPGLWFWLWSALDPLYWDLSEAVKPALTPVKTGSVQLWVCSHKPLVIA